MNKKISGTRSSIFFIVIALVLSGCATAPGAGYSGLLPLETGKGDVYLYRTKALYAIGQSFSTTVQGQPGGDLYNGSYLLFRLDPGSYDIGVQPGSLAVTSQRTVEVKAGERSFYQYDFPSLPLGNIFFIGSSIEPRTQDVAEADLKDLTAAKLNLTEKLEIYRATNFASLEDVDAMPLATAQGKAAYRSWLTKALPRAFVIADNTMWVATWGNNPPDKTESTDTVVRAMARCIRRKNVNCKVYAVDNRVVWTTDAVVAKNAGRKPALDMTVNTIAKKPAAETALPPAVAQVATPTPQPAPAPAPAPATMTTPAVIAPTETPRYSSSSVTPIFSQLLKADYPDGFTTIAEQSGARQYMREAVPTGEDKANWTRKFTITGTKGLADNAAITPTLFAEKIEEDIQRSCPASFSRKTLSEGNVNGYDQFISVLSCGTAAATQGKTSESMLLIVIKGEHDYYTVQSADRAAPSSVPLPINPGQWLTKRKNLGAIKLCTPVAGETAPYASCTGS